MMGTVTFRDVLVAMLLFGVVLVGFGIYTIVSSGRDRRTVASWLPASGVVTGSVRGTTPAAIDDGATVALDYPVVRYVDVEGREREGQARTASSWQRYRPGQAVAIRYDPRNPQRLVVAGSPSPGVLTRVVAVFFVLFGLFFLAIGLVGLLLVH